MTLKNKSFFDKIDYTEYKDENLIDLANDGNKKALNTIIDRYKDMVNIKVTKYYITGAEKEDLVQEGLIGLYKSIKNFNIEKEKSFKNFAIMCVDRQIITAIKCSKRQKHIPLNSYISLNNEVYDNSTEESSEQLINVLKNNLIEDPLEMITRTEQIDNIHKEIEKKCSDFEKQVLYKYLEGESYQEIADDLDIKVKSVDNAIQRIRKKTKNQMLP